jgi:two-component system sensor histidine kinase UhpB
LNRILARFSEVAWFGKSIRHQVLLAIFVMLVLCAFAAATTAVFNGRKSVNVEIEASMDFAEGYLRELVRRITAEGRINELDYLVSREVQHLRHARVYEQDLDGSRHILKNPESPTNDSSADDDTPDWFESLMMPKGGNEHSRLILVPGSSKSILLKGDPDDEIAEKWHELSALAVVAIISITLLVAAFWLVLGRILDPLVELARGLVALQEGERSQRLPIPRVREVGDIAKKFNALAASLDQTRAENGELYRQIQYLQEEERKEIARELHDEAGPCLFGITASAESIKTLVSGSEDTNDQAIDKRTEEILTIAHRLKSMNRSLLKRLHPVSLGKVSLHALIADLIRGFESLNPKIHFLSFIEGLAGEYGERVDLTVYRATQEALTNALRHGRATKIVVDLKEEYSKSSSGKACVIHLNVSDDGIGFSPETRIGFGLSAMRERVLSAGGTLSIKKHEPRGTTVSVKIPVQPVRIKSMSTEITYQASP